MAAGNRKSTREKGRDAEKLAARYLAGKGYRILDRNFECSVGEIDIIARHGKELVFVEVRSRHSASAPDPAYSVNYRKQRQIINTAEVYLDRHFDQPPAARFDVVIVTLRGQPQVEIIQDAFTA